MAAMNDALTEVRFWAQVMTDAECTIVCSPVNKDRIQAWVDGRGLGHRLTVLASPIPRDTELYIVDRRAMAAWEHEQAARPIKWWP
jgi:hypothetical protein